MRRLASYAAALAFALLLPAATAAAQDAQPNAPERREEINHEVQLYLLVASNARDDGGGVPKSVQPVIRQLRATLPFADYRVASTFFNRVRNGGSVEVSGIGGPPLASPSAANNPYHPAFFNFSLHDVRLTGGAADQPFVQIAQLRFGLKIPIQTASVGGEGGKASYPVIQYQDTGIKTAVSVREGVPTVIGTLAGGQPDVSFILVAILSRAPTR